MCASLVYFSWLLPNCPPWNSSLHPNSFWLLEGLSVRRHERRSKKAQEKWTCTLVLAFSGFAGVWPSLALKDIQNWLSWGVLIEAKGPSGNIQWCVSWYKMPICTWSPGSARWEYSQSLSQIPTWGALGQAKMALCHLSLLHGPYLISQSQIWAWLFTYLCPTTDEYVANSFLLLCYFR